MQLESNVRPAAEFVAEVVNAAIPGHSRGRAYQRPEPTELAREFKGRLPTKMSKQIGPLAEAGERLVRLAKAFHPVFAAETMAETAQVINELLRTYRAQPYLVEDAGQPFHLHFHGDAKDLVESYGGEFAVALALVVDAYGTKRFGQCDAEECDRVYVDLTRNGARRYCSDACNARAKMAAYRKRKPG